MDCATISCMPWLLTTLLALGSLAGCGTPSGGTDGVVSLGPSPIGGDDSADVGGADDATSNGDSVPPNDTADDDPNDEGGGDDGTLSNDNADDESPGGGPFADACEAVRNRGFTIADRTLAFSDSIFSWVTSGGQVVGVFTCDGFSLLGVSAENEQFVGSYDALSDTVTWQGTIYLPDP